jgi:hypothetical protein
MPARAADVSGEAHRQGSHVIDAHGGLKLPVLRVNVGGSVLLVIQEIHSNDDRIEHRNERHRSRLAPKPTPGADCGWHGVMQIQGSDTFDRDRSGSRYARYP